MRTQHQIFIAGAIALLANASHTFAASSPNCAAIQDSLQRLACYDAQNGRPASPATAPAAPAAPLPQQSVQPVQAAPVAVAVTAPEQPRAKISVPIGPDDFVTVVSTVTKVAYTADMRLLITLENGQVWLQLERDSAIEVAAGDKVTVRKAAMGSRTLEARGGLRTKVKQRS